MQICKFIDNKPAEIQTLPSAWRNISNPKLANMAGDGWREYVPATDANIKASHWQDDGLAVREIVDAVWTAEELAAQEAQAAAEVETRRREYEANANALLALSRDLNHAELRTRALALVLLDEHNRASTWLRSFVAAVAASTSFPNLQTRVATLAAMPDRTAAQLRQAVIAKAQELQ
jgi:hypothetical protein